ncbi:MAG: phage shock protein PspA [Aestuariibacter sp.]
MSVFTRINDIIQSNLNAMLDKAEDPEKLLSLIISEMEESLVELRSIAAKHIADQKTHQRKLTSLERRAEDWETKATVALQKNREDLARAALIEKQKISAEIEELAHYLEVVSEQLEKIREDSGRLTSKVAEAKAKRKAMYTRFEHAKTRLDIKAQHEKYDVDAVMQRFDGFESKIDELEAKVDSYDLVEGNASLEAQFQELQANDAIDAELQALKKKVA